MYTKSMTALLLSSLLIFISACTPPPQIFTTQATLSGSAVVSPTDSEASGEATIRLDQNSGAISGALVVDGMAATRASLHEGGLGENGPEILSLRQSASDPNRFLFAPGAKLTATERTTLEAGGLYLSVASDAYPAGEIRGQVAGILIEPTLASIQEHIFTPDCADSGCHGPPTPFHGMDYSEGKAYGNLVYKQSYIEPPLNLVEPGDPDNSYLIHKLEGTSIAPSMPLLRPLLPRYKVNVVRQWIASLEPSPQPTLVYIQRNIFDASCATSGCHNTADQAGDLDLSAGNALDQLLDVPSITNPGLWRVHPGEPENSSLVLLMDTIANSNVDHGGASVTPEQAAAVSQWVYDLRGPQATLDWIQSNVFDASCAYAGCHDAVTKSFGLDLSEGAVLAETVRVPAFLAPNVELIAPGDPDNSFLYQKLFVDTIGARMPWAAPALSEEKIQAVYDWIAAMDDSTQYPGEPDDPGTPPPDGTTNPPQYPQAEASISWVQENIFDPSCATAGCHDTQTAFAQLDLSAGNAVTNIVNVPSTQSPTELLVTPGSASESYLYKKMTGAGQGLPMPLTADEALSDAQIQAVADWINQLSGE